MSATYLAMLRPLKNRAISWSEDCHGNPLARITVLSHTFSILLLHTHTHTGIITVDYQGTKITCIFNKCYSPSAALELLTNSLGVRKRVACNSKVTESP